MANRPGVSDFQIAWRRSGNMFSMHCRRFSISSYILLNSLFFTATKRENSCVHKFLLLFLLLWRCHQRVLLFWMPVSSRNEIALISRTFPNIVRLGAVFLSCVSLRCTGDSHSGSRTGLMYVRMCLRTYYMRAGCDTVDCLVFYFFKAAPNMLQFFIFIFNRNTSNVITLVSNIVT